MSVPVPAPSSPSGAPGSPAGGARALTIDRDADARPARGAGWREVRATFFVPPAARAAADAVRPLLDDPELHFTPGLRRGSLAVLPRLDALTRVALTWEWTVEAAELVVHDWGETVDEEARRAYDAWLRGAARSLVATERAVDDAVARVVRDAADGLAVSRPPRAELTVGPTASRAEEVGDATAAEGPTRPEAGAGRAATATAVLVTALAVPDPSAAHPRVDVVVPDPTDPGREDLVDARTGRRLGERRTQEHEGLATAFTYRVADGVDDVVPADLVRWHDQHIQAQMLADDARQAYVHLLAGIDPPASVRYA